MEEADETPEAEEVAETEDAVVRDGVADNVEELPIVDDMLPNDEETVELDDMAEEETIAT